MESEGETMMKAEELRDGLAQFTGTDGYAKYPGGLLLTDGIRFLAENAGAFWLLDVIASYQPRCRRDPMLRDMQFWTLKRVPDTSKAVVTCDDGDGHVKITQKIPFTDFPLAEVKIWVELGSADGVNPHYVVMLPGER